MLETYQKKKDQKKFSGRWTRSEQERFLNALEKYGRNWVLVQKAVKTRNLTQVRSHAQKVFLKMSKADIEALIGDDTEMETLQKYQEKDESYILCEESVEPSGNLLESLKQSLQEVTIEAEKNFEEGSETVTKILPQKEELNLLTSCPNSAFFLKVIEANLEHFQTGKGFLDLTPAYHQQANVGFIPFNGACSSKGTQTSTN